MSLDVERESPAIEGIDVLVRFIASGEKRPGTLKVGTEHEKLPIHLKTLAPVGYDDGIKALLLGLTERGWQPDPSRDAPIALHRAGASVTLEPGGQFELSGAPFSTLHETAAELSQHLREVLEVARPLGIGFLGLGYRPFDSTSAMPWMPKPRYRVMRDYLPRHGDAALEMMLLSATVQANFDYVSEADMAAKMRGAMSASPIVAALFAASPFVGNAWSGYRTRRYAMWRDVDADCCGLLPFVFDDDFGYRQYVEWALDVPMFFIRRAGAYKAQHGVTFRQFMTSGIDGERATLADFENHLSTLFPEVRLKTYLEVRSADAASPELALALPALWKGLLYDDEALKSATALLADLSFPERLGMQVAVAQHGLGARGASWHALELARELVRLAADGLRRQRALDASGKDERSYLAPLEGIVTTGRTLADDLLLQFGAGPHDDATRRAIVTATLL